MRFRVRHTTRYSYDVPVSLGPHVVRLIPQARNGLHTLLAHNLNVDPVPQQRNLVIDAFGNQVLELAFFGSTSQFSVVSEFELISTEPGFVDDAALPDLPWNASSSAGGWQPDEVSAFHHVEQPASEVREFALEVAAGARFRPYAFLERLTATLYERIDRRVRLEGAAQPPSETLQRKQGACRDITVLFLATCRALGMTGRFVSGYQAAAETPDGRRYLHAWPEVYLPGVGFVGFDPTHGQRVRDGHVPLAVGPAQAATMPIEGGFSFSGPVVNSTLEFEVRIETDGSW